VNKLSIERVSDSKQIADSAVLARSFLSRAKGLIGKRLFLAGEGLIILPCKMVHMFFMSFAIDVVFCRADGTVLAIEENLQPWKFSRHVPDSSFVIELPAGIARVSSLQIGDVLRYSHE